MNERRSNLKWFGLLTGLLLVVMIFELVATLSSSRALVTDIAGQSWLGFSVEGARLIVTTCSRAHNQLVGLIFISIALAVPLTASHYTPKLLRLFVTHRVHQMTLTAYALAAAHANWVMYLSGHDRVETVLTASVLITTTLGFVLVVPYFFYVIRFLEPSTVSALIRDIAIDVVKRAPENPRSLDRAYVELPDGIYGLGGVVLKAVDRVDRRTSLDAIEAIRAMLSVYGNEKARFPDAWFRAPKDDFRGMSDEALEFLTADRAWVEMLAFQQLLEAFESSLTRMTDAASAVSDTVRGIGVDASERDDDGVLLNAIRTMNSLLRMAISARRPRAIFDVLAQYLLLGQALVRSSTARTVEVAKNFSFYGVYARENGIPFIPVVVAYDLGELLKECSRAGSDAEDGVLTHFKRLLSELADAPSVSLACTILVTLGRLFARPECAAVTCLLGVLEPFDDDVVIEALSIVESAKPRYWELTDRDLDLNYLHPPEFEGLEALLAQHRPQVLERKGSGHRRFA